MAVPASFPFPPSETGWSRVVLKLILEPIFESDFQPGSYGYRPKRSAHQAVRRVSEAVLRGKTYVIDLESAAPTSTM